MVKIIIIISSSISLNILSK